MNKTERISIKLLPQDKAALSRLAQAEGEPVAVVVRKIIRQAIRPTPQINPPAQPSATPAQEGGASHD